MRRRFWRASGWLSTSGGSWFAIELGECTRKARAACGLLEGCRAMLLGATGDDEGRNAELDMARAAVTTVATCYIKEQSVQAKCKKG